MKKVLIIGHFWPYRGGSKRIFGLAKYLKEYGWEPIVLTGNLNKKPEANFRYIENSYYGFLGKWGRFLGINPKANTSNQLKEKLDRKKKLLSVRFIFRYMYHRLAEICAFPDEDKNWKKVAVESVGELLKKEKVDVIISVWPATSHLIAKEIKDIYKIPWIADFPDLWSQNYHYPYSFIRRYFEKKLEIKTLKTVDAITTVSIPLKNQLKKIYKDKKIYDITLGFDSEKETNYSGKIADKFTLTYTGLVYRGKQDISKIFIAIRDLIDEKVINSSEIEVRFFGPKDYLIDKMIKKFSLSSIVKQYGIVSREEALARQRDSQLLLFLNWEDKNQKGVYTGKIFEYLAADRPIISTGGFKDVVYDLLNKTGAGESAFTINEIKESFKKLYLEYKEKKVIDYKGNPEEINKYSNREMSKKFSDILNTIYEKS